jgi:hypothetical protein
MGAKVHHGGTEKITSKAKPEHTEVAEDREAKEPYL